jgi:hypothetical protein
VVDAIEPNPAWAAAAAPFYRRIYQSGVEEAALEPGSYQVVVCADVLEHTVDPAAVLQALRAAAAPDARFVISLPNVAHLAARLLLLTGRFPQMERGIFDRTHLHFFTRQTAIELVRSVGLQVIDVRATPLPLTLILRAPGSGWLVRTLMRAQQPALRLRPTLFAYQWILVAEPSPSSIS